MANMYMGPYLLRQGGGRFICELCNRIFTSPTALYSHCRNTTYHGWCERCFEVIPPHETKEEHFWGSSKHNICVECETRPDFQSEDVLLDHIVMEHGLLEELDMDSFLSGEMDKVSILTTKFHCKTCGARFTSENSLRMHTQTHEPDDIECYGCDLGFKTFSGMLIHLEHGSCASRTTRTKINNIACSRQQRKEYMFPFKDGRWVYQCWNCLARFTRLSALYQHAEDVQRCSGSLNSLNSLAKLERAIAREITLPRQYSSRPSSNEPCAMHFTGFAVETSRS